MSGILGGQSMPPSILGGGYRPIRQVSMPQGQPQPMQANPFAMMGPGQGEAPAYGSDEWAMQTGGPGAMIMRELMRGFSEHGLGALAPDMAGKVFSPEFRALLAPEYQRQPKGK